MSGYQMTKGYWRSRTAAKNPAISNTIKTFSTATTVDPSGPRSANQKSSRG